MELIGKLKYSTAPYKHQMEALEQAWGHATFALFCEQGTGKSKVIIDEIVNLIEQNEINCAIVLAPNGVHENWKEQFETHGPPNYNKWIIQVYKSSDSLAKREALTRDIIKSGKVLVFLMNIEALSYAAGSNYLERILRARHRTYLAIDESHKIKTFSARRTKEAIRLGVTAKYKRIATGTEAEEGLENLYSQMRFLDWRIIGARTMTQFKHLYCVMGGFEGHEIIGYQNKEFLAARIAPYIYQKRKKDCLDLPDKVFITHHIDLTPDQDRMYTQLEEQLILQLESGELVDATLAVTQLIKLQQVLCGHVTSTESHQVIEISSHRARYTSELVASESGKTIVFCRFVKDVDLVCRQLKMDDIDSISISGEVKNRLERINLWRSEKNIKALVMTIATGGTGLTLNEASNVIFYSNDWSATNRIQAEDRNHRIGQANKVTYHDLTVRDKIDEKILKALRAKFNLSAKFRQLLDANNKPGYKANVVRDLLHNNEWSEQWEPQREVTTNETMNSSAEMTI